MQRIYFFLLFTILSLVAFGQGISESIQASSVKAYINADGPLFFKDYQEPGFYVTDFNGIDVEIPTIFASGLWIGARRTGENFMRVSRSYYTNEDFLVGPANYGGDFDFNRVWKVTGQEIIGHIQDFADGVIDETPAQNILDWPGYGNPLLGSEFPAQMFASFFDQDQNGIYDPYMGDYPIINGELINVRPLEMAFAVFHDNPLGETPIGIEVHATMYSLDCENETALDRAIFTSHKIINMDMNIEELFVGNWSDFDLGCYLDDHIGFDPDRGVTYCYNEDEYDGDSNEGCGASGGTFENNPVVHASKFLNQDLYSTIISYSPTTGSVHPATNPPVEESEIANFIQGRWRDGLPLTFGGTGYNPGSTNYVDHLFPSDPIDPNGWSMNADDFPSSDYRSVSSVKLNSLFPGSSVTFDMVQLVTMDADYDYLEKVSLNLSEMDLLQEAYDNEFANVCTSLPSPITDTEVENIEIYPNPTAVELTIEHSEDLDSYKIFDTSGRIMRTGSIAGPKNTIELNLSDGIYWIQCSNTNEVFTAQKFVVVNR